MYRHSTNGARRHNFLWIVMEVFALVATAGSRSSIIEPHPTQSLSQVVVVVVDWQISLSWWLLLTLGGIFFSTTSRGRDDSSSIIFWDLAPPRPLRDYCGIVVVTVASMIDSSEVRILIIDFQKYRRTLSRGSTYYFESQMLHTSVPSYLLR